MKILLIKGFKNQYDLKFGGNIPTNQSDFRDTFIVRIYN